MLSLYGELKENENSDLCIDGIPVTKFLDKYQGKEVSISICVLEEEEE